MFTPDELSPIAKCLQIAHRRGQQIRREHEWQAQQAADDATRRDDECTPITDQGSDAQ